VDDYSPSEVEAIITAAKAALSKDSVLSLSFADSQMLQRLLEVLPRYVGAQSDAQVIVSELRETLYSSLSVPSTENLHRVCANCTKCSSAVTRASTPLWNIADPDVMLVLENPFILKKKQNVDVLVAALKASGFSSTRICCTYATRCEFPNGQLGSPEYANCASYLYHEIHSLKPKLVVTFGAPVYGVLTQLAPKSFKDIVGQISWLGSVPVMPLFSINYLTKLYSKIDDVQSSLETHFKTAHNFCYGD